MFVVLKRGSRYTWGSGFGIVRFKITRRYGELYEIYLKPSAAILINVLKCLKEALVIKFI